MKSSHRQFKYVTSCLALLPSLLMGGALASASLAHAQPAAAPAKEATMLVTHYSDLQLLETAGWVVGQQTQVSTLGFTDEQLAAILRGLNLALSGKPAPYAMETVGPRMSAFMQARVTEAATKAQQAAKEREAQFFGVIAKKAGVRATPSGLYYEILVAGAETKPTDTSSVTVDYTGTLPNGTVFDSSISRGQPATLGLPSVIAGWREGLQLIGVGGKIRLYIPYALAYGEQAKPEIPAFSTLVFEVTLHAIGQAPTAPPAPAAH